MKTKLNKIALASLVALGTMLPINSQAQVGVEVIIGMPGVAILNYHEVVEVDIPAAALTALIGGTAAGDAMAFEEGQANATAAENAGELEADFAINVTEPTNIDFTNIPLLLQNVWSVRGINNGDMEVVAGAGDQQTLTNGAASIVTSNPEVPQAAFAAPGMNPNNAVSGDVRLALDLSNATAVGNYDGGGQSTYTLTVNLL
ncbi:hypothetical protein [Vreelandella zhaodongensis]|uniref:WxL domain-containing protein n=1 Tax=Vreelandella zhaodongensis TaxID=1176240 RepID=A0ABX2SRU5_VREZH|nr:hypothetical protein [Halomonas zhaodongensis]NYS44124.1 hypothetical protein [Halomonas zhaodongensis]